jgi:hypothetical protein
VSDLGHAVGRRCPAHASGKTLAAAALVGGGVALTVLTVFFTAIFAYHQSTDQVR